MPYGVSDDLAAGQLAIAGDADLERNRVTSQLSFSLTAVGDLRNRVDADRLQTPELVGWLIEGVRCSKAALVHRG